MTNFTSISDAELDTRYESSELNLIGVDPNESNVEVRANRNIEFSYNTGSGWSSWVAVEANAIIPLPTGSQNYLIKLAYVTPLTYSTVITITIEDTVAGKLDPTDWVITTKAMPPSYIADLSDSTQQMVVNLINQANNSSLTVDDVVITNHITFSGGDVANTEATVTVKPNRPVVGSVTIRYRRMELGLLDGIEEANFEVNTTSLNPADVVSAVNTKYGTAFTTDDFNWSNSLPVPDSDGENYQLIPATNNAAFIGNLGISVRTPFLTGKTTEMASGPFVMFTDAAVINDKMYIPGGRRYTVETGEVTINELNIYNFTTNTWSTGTPGGATGASPAVWGVGSKVYVLGGTSKANTLSIYTPATDSWETKSISSLPGTQRDGIAVTSINNSIYFCGGRVGSVNTNALWRYDTLTDAWTQLANCPVSLTNAALVAIDNMLYFGTGWNGTSTVNVLYRYDVANNTWSQMASCSIARQYAGYAAINGKMYVCQGGMGGNVRTPSIEIYDPVTNSWEIISNAGYLLVTHSCVAYNNAIYLHGGRDNNTEVFNKLIKVT